jgi:D-alanyl-lipoteichoic acid biosynthesis protein DltD
MKKIFVICFIHDILSFVFLYLVVFKTSLNRVLWAENSKDVKSSKSFDLIISYEDQEANENQFLASDSSRAVIFLLGSSELINNSPAVPYRFITSHFTTKVKAIGHAGNQCFSLFAQLLANTDRLNQAPVTFIISPGWFESKNTKGTSAEVFLEFNSERFIKSIYRDTADREFQQYAAKRISQMYSEFNSPNLLLKLMNENYLASKSIIHRICFEPLICFDRFLLNRKEKLEGLETKVLIPKRLSLSCDSVRIPWDSLFDAGRADALKKATNNSMGINNAYYTEYIHGRTGKIEPVDQANNQELEDFKLLIRLVSAKKVNASFIISPLNALYYKNLREIDPTIQLVEKEIQDAHFPCLNLLCTDVSKYEKPVLTDIMHMADYGWYKADQFIVSTYQLNK